ncbi:MAG: hypothetical protein ABJA02_06270 [Acidobacteriota bacterium]
MADLDNYYAPKAIGGYRSIALGIGGIATLLWAVGVYLQPEQGLRSWLLGFIFWSGITIGSLGILMLQYLTGGAWGVVIRRIVEAGTRTLPLIVLCFIPLAYGVFTNQVYSWTHLPITDHVMVQRGLFMTAPYWILRSFIYFAIFGGIIYLLNKWSSQQDLTNDLAASERLLEKSSRFSGPMMVVYCVIVTFAVVDWIMTLDPHWFSTIWGLLFVAGWALSCLSFAVVILAYLADKAPMNAVLGKRHFHDLGKLMLALTMVWAYFNFSQFLVIWSGNLPEETSWYLSRMRNGWGYIGVFLILFHFAFPFLVLLQQDFKRHAKWLAWLGVVILAMRLVDVYYQIGAAPRIAAGYEDASFLYALSWMDFVAPVAIGGLWMWWFLGELVKRPLVPFQDPFFESAIEHGKGH